MVYDTETRELTMARAGHDPALVLEPDSQEVHRYESGGMAVGLVDSELFDQIIDTTTITLDPGTLVLIYTDGITEAMDSNKQEWGLEPLSRALMAGRDRTPNQVSDIVRERVLRFVGEMPQYDDMTLMVLKAGD
jgi:sigma-B regulation protein RsbU (phosphoserine phosphatase)